MIYFEPSNSCSDHRDKHFCIIAQGDSDSIKMDNPTGQRPSTDETGHEMMTTTGQLRNETGYDSEGLRIGVGDVSNDSLLDESNDDMNDTLLADAAMAASQEMKPPATAAKSTPEITPDSEMTPDANPKMTPDTPMANNGEERRSGRTRTKVIDYEELHKKGRSASADGNTAEKNQKTRNTRRRGANSTSSATSDRDENNAAETIDALSRKLLDKEGEANALEDQLKTAKLNHLKAIERLRTNHKNEIQTLQDNHRKEVQTLQQKHLQEKTSMTDHEKEMSDLEEKRSEALESQVSKQKATIKEKEKSIQGKDQLINTYRIQLGESATEMVKVKKELKELRDHQNDQTTNTRLENEIKRKDAMIMETINELTASRNEVDELKAATQDMQSQYSKAVKDAERHEKQAAKLYAKLKKMESEAKMESEPETEKEPIVIEVNKKAIAIQDSNREYVLPYLSATEFEWDSVDTIFTVEEMTKQVTEGQLTETIKEYDHLNLMLGTNEIRKGVDPMQLALQMSEVIKEVTQLCPNTTVSVTEIPPLQHRYESKDENRKDYNYFLRREGLNLIETEDKLGALKPEDRTREDGFHIRRKGGRIIGEAIDKQAPKFDLAQDTKHAQSAEKDLAPDESIEVDRDALGKIIGKGGTNLNRIKNNLEVKIKIDEDGEAPTVEIWGKRAHEAKEDVAATLKKHREDKRVKYQLRAETDDDHLICRHFLRGRCNFGSNCKKRHPTPRSSKSRSPHRSRSPSRQTEKRGRQQSTSRRVTYEDEPKVTVTSNPIKIRSLTRK